MKESCATTLMFSENNGFRKMPTVCDRNHIFSIYGPICVSHVGHGYVNNAQPILT